TRPRRVYPHVHGRYGDHRALHSFPTHALPISFSDETAAAQAQIDALRAQGVNKIILMSHIGYGNDRAIIPNLSGVDVVVGGDSRSAEHTSELQSRANLVCRLPLEKER